MLTSLLGDLSQAYKFYGKIHFAEAVRQCQKDGAFLTMAKSQRDADDIKLLLKSAGADESRVPHDCLRLLAHYLLYHFPFR